LKSLDIQTDVEKLLADHFNGLHSGGGRSSIAGGQTAADRALTELNVAGYANKRSEVLPVAARGATVLSPYIRHNLLTLEKVWSRVAKAPYTDREKYRDELLWQEYSRHLYARVGARLFNNLRFEQVRDAPGDGWVQAPESPESPESMACIDFAVEELGRDGWLVNQTRMWLASQWTVRNGYGWLHGQERMYRELIDGSRAANLTGWQWVVGSGNGRPYGLSQWQVQKRAPELCGGCALKSNCPIQFFPDENQLDEAPTEPLLASDPDPGATAGPSVVVKNGTPQFVLLTIESMGDQDPALIANPTLPVVFVFNDLALRKLQLSSKRIFFYLETLQDLAQRRDVHLFLGDPYEFARENSVAVTYAPVPSFKKFTALAEIHPYPWLKRPHAKSVKSFSAWRGKLR
jgi:deoxyribodipyrimidine photo-lyase